MHILMPDISTQTSLPVLADEKSWQRFRGPGQHKELAANNEHVLL